MFRFNFWNQDDTTTTNDYTYHNSDIYISIPDNETPSISSSSMLTKLQDHIKLIENYLQDNQLQEDETNKAGTMSLGAFLPAMGLAGLAGGSIYRVASIVSSQTEKLHGIYHSIQNLNSTYQNNVTDAKHLFSTTEIPGTGQTCSTLDSKFQAGVKYDCDYDYIGRLTKYCGTIAHDFCVYSIDVSLSKFSSYYDYKDASCCSTEKFHCDFGDMDYDCKNIDVDASNFKTNTCYELMQRYCNYNTLNVYYRFFSETSFGARYMNDIIPGSPATCASLYSEAVFQNCATTSNMTETVCNAVLQSYCNMTTAYQESLINLNHAYSQANDTLNNSLYAQDNLSTLPLWLGAGFLSVMGLALTSYQKIKQYRQQTSVELLTDHLTTDEDKNEFLEFLSQLDQTLLGNLSLSDLLAELKEHEKSLAERADARNACLSFRFFSTCEKEIVKDIFERAELVGKGFNLTIRK